VRKPWLPSPALVVACLALLITLSGVAYAAKALPRNSVGTTQLKANAVNGFKVTNDSLTGADIKESTLAGVLKTGALDAFMGTVALGPALPTVSGSTEWVTQTWILQKPARLLVTAHLDPQLDCDAVPCGTVYFLSVDDTPVPNSQFRVGANLHYGSAPVTITGLTATLPAGSHQIKLLEKQEANVLASGAGQRVISAIVIG